MLSAADNELLCRVGPGTPMGAMFSEYWWPVLRADKLEADGDPERVRLLGRDFVAFRASDGKLGFLDEGCPHRGASMVLGRNEDCGLRCVLHGWKIDTEGRILETPNEAAPPGDKKRAAHYPIREAGGMIWVWIGDGEPAPFPEHPFNHLELEVQVKPVAAYFECNYLQLMETLWDPAHVGILHGTGESMKRAWGDANPGLANSIDGNMAAALSASGCQVSDERWGFKYQFGGREGMAGRGSVPTVMPSWIFIGALGADENADRITFAHVPIDDTHTILWQLAYNPVQEIGAVGNMLVAGGHNPHDWRPENMSRETNWTQDREAMRNGSWTGIGEGRGTIGLLMQDVAMSESMGGIVDREKEHLGPADAAIVAGRRVFMAALRAHMAGEPALGAHADVSNVGCPGGEETIPIDAEAEPALA
jgi:phthalate 4,5-dioxygenase